MRAEFLALEEAISYGNLSLAIVQNAIEQGLDPNQPCGERQDNLLCLSVSLGEDATVQYLLERNASPNLKGEGGEFALHLAVRFDQPQNIQSLLAHGANPNLLDSEGQSALHVGNRDVRHAKALLAYGANPNLPDAQGKTPIQGASWNVLECLIEHGANVNQLDGEGRTLLHYFRDHEQIVQSLVGHGIQRPVDGDPLQLIYDRAVANPAVQEKNAIAVVFEGNFLAHHSINKKTHENFRFFYEAWKDQMQKQKPETFSQMSDTAKLHLFNEYCNAIQWMPIFEKQKADNRKKFLYFSLGKHNRVGAGSPVYQLVPDIMGLIAKSLATGHAQSEMIMKIHSEALAGAGLDEHFSIVHRLRPRH